MSFSQSFSYSYHSNHEETDDSSTVFDADTVIPDEVPSLPPASPEESPQSFTSVLLRRINSRHRPAEPSTTTATAAATATTTRSEEMSRSNHRQSSSSSSSKKRPIITNSSGKRKQLQENSTSTTTKKSSTKRPRRSSRVKRQPQDQNCTDDKSDSEVEDYEPDEAVINQPSSSSSSSSQTSTTKLTKREVEWRSKFEELRAYKQLHGHTNVPARWENNKKLGLWVVNQRREYKKFQANKHSYITEERIEKLESIDFEWVVQKKYPRKESKWNKRFNELKEYKEKYERTDVPRNFKDNKELGKWVSHQRTEYKKFQKNGKGKITLERIQKLESIDFEWVAPETRFEKDESSWNKRFNELKDYKEKYGRTDVPRDFKVNKELGNWVKKQRAEYKNFQANKKSQITLERIDLLNSIGFQWECRPARAPRS